MNPVTVDALRQYWSQQEVAINLVVFANLFGALLLGLIVGYERAYHGRAAGMRTYGLVCMASCGITVIAGYPDFWYGGHELGSLAGHLPPDPTRVIQGVVTGVGFLGAGVIMKEGTNISGLTTAASIWSASAIGVMVGVGFYFASILLTLLSASLMLWASRLEQWLPSRPAISVLLRFRPGVVPQEAQLAAAARERGYSIASGTFHLRMAGGRQEWQFVAIQTDRRIATPLSGLAAELAGIADVEEFHLGHARN